MDERRDHLCGFPLRSDDYLRDTVSVAKALLGTILVHEAPTGILAGRIVETEAYTSDDPASHALRGLTRRNSAMFGPPGHAYVYRIHTHWCLNAVTRDNGVGEAVLIRALEPLVGVEAMMESRGSEDRRRLCNGPGRLTQAMRISGSHDGMDLTAGTLRIVTGEPILDVVQTTRVGIRHAADMPWRFYSREHQRFVSKR